MLSLLFWVSFLKVNNFHKNILTKETDFKRFLGGLFALWKDLTEYLSAEFAVGDDGAGGGHLAHNVTPEMVSKTD